MRPLFPYFGTKRKVAAEVWRRFGRVSAYVEPFCGSAAVFLGCPYKLRSVVLNDADGMIVNFWRAAKHYPEEVEQWATTIRSTLDLQARKRWLKEHVGELVPKLKADPEYCCARSAGYWWYLQSNAIGQDVVVSNGAVGSLQLGCPAGIQTGQHPALSSVFSDSLSSVQVLCEDASQILESRTRLFGGTPGQDSALFMDPPYLGTEDYYQEHTLQPFHQVTQWAEKHAPLYPNLRIAICGHDGDWDAPDGWVKHIWSRDVGYSVNGKSGTQGEKARHTDCIWFSPNCIDPNRWEHQPLFPGV